MADYNPYTPPQTPSGLKTPGESELAERGLRLAGSLLDGLFQAICMALIFTVYVLANGLEPALQTLAQAGLGMQIMLALIGMTVFGLLNSWLLLHRGQTLGKVICKTRIVAVDGRPLGLNALLVKRYFLPMLLQQLPLGGALFALANALFIFREDRRCLHDHLAGTIVIKR